MAEAQLTSRLGGFETFCSDQLNYSILDRFVEMEVLRVCKKFNIGVTIWAPLHNGWLSGKYRKGQAPPAGTRGADKARVDFEAAEGSGA